VVASYSELYEEGEVDHINGVWPDFLLMTANFNANNIHNPYHTHWGWSQTCIKTRHVACSSAFD